MKPKKILVVPKITTLDEYRQQFPYYARFPALTKRLLDDLRNKNLNADDINREDKDHYESLAEVLRVLEHHRLKYDITSIPNLSGASYEGVDLVIPVGGDGTALYAAHHIFDDTLFFGVNSVTWRSKGRWLISNKDNFQSKLEKILDDEHIISPVRRIEARVYNSNNSYGLALNEIKFGKLGFKLSRYNLIGDDFEEYQMSSGIVISMTEGSSGWLDNIPRAESYAGHEQDLQFVIQEPRNKGLDYDHNQGFSTEIKIVSDDIKTVVALDSDEDKFAFPIERGQYVKIRASDKPLHMVSFD
jgi:hypothetical protein